MDSAARDCGQLQPIFHPKPTWQYRVMDSAVRDYGEL